MWLLFWASLVCAAPFAGASPYDVYVDTSEVSIRTASDGYNEPSLCLLNYMFDATTKQAWCSNRFKNDGLNVDCSLNSGGVKVGAYDAGQSIEMQNQRCQLYCSNNVYFSGETCVGFAHNTNGGSTGGMGCYFFKTLTFQGTHLDSCYGTPTFSDPSDPPSVVGGKQYYYKRLFTLEPTNSPSHSPSHPPTEEPSKSPTHAPTAPTTTAPPTTIDTWTVVNDQKGNNDGSCLGLLSDAQTSEITGITLGDCKDTCSTMVVPGGECKAIAFEIDGRCRCYGKIHNEGSCRFNNAYDEWISYARVPTPSPTPSPSAWPTFKAGHGQCCRQSNIPMTLSPTPPTHAPTYSPTDPTHAPTKSPTTPDPTAAPTQLHETFVHVGASSTVPKTVLQPNIIIIHLDDSGQGDWTTYHDARYEWVDLATGGDTDGRAAGRNWIDNLWADKDHDGKTTIGHRTGSDIPSTERILDCPSNPADELDPRVSSKPYPANQAQGRDIFKRTTGDYKCEHDYVNRTEYELNPAFYDGMYREGVKGVLGDAGGAGGTTTWSGYGSLTSYGGSGPLTANQNYSMEGWSYDVNFAMGTSFNSHLVMAEYPGNWELDEWDGMYATNPRAATTYSYESLYTVTDWRGDTGGASAENNHERNRRGSGGGTTKEGIADANTWTEAHPKPPMYFAMVRSAETPRVDELAADGIRFNHFHSTSQVCAPSRHGILTGRTASRDKFDYVDFAGKNQDGEGAGAGKSSHAKWCPAKTVNTLAWEAKKFGYKTWFGGKWHIGDLHIKTCGGLQRCGPHPPTLTTPIEYGFDEYWGTSTNAAGNNPTTHCMDRDNDGQQLDDATSVGVHSPGGLGHYAMATNGAMCADANYDGQSTWSSWPKNVDNIVMKRAAGEEFKNKDEFITDVRYNNKNLTNADPDNVFSSGSGGGNAAEYLVNGMFDFWYKSKSLTGGPDDGDDVAKLWDPNEPQFALLNMWHMHTPFTGESKYDGDSMPECNPRFDQLAGGETGVPAFPCAVCKSYFVEAASLIPSSDWGNYDTDGNVPDVAKQCMEKNATFHWAPPDSAATATCSTHPQLCVFHWHGMGEHRIDGVKNYRGGLKQVDDAVGHLIDTLKTYAVKGDETEDHGTAFDNTVIIFTSDNGHEHRHWGAGSPGQWQGCKREMKEGGHRMPGLLSWPAAINGEFSTNFTASATDILPTITDMFKREGAEKKCGASHRRRYEDDGVTAIPPSSEQLIWDQCPEERITMLYNPDGANNGPGWRESDGDRDCGTHDCIEYMSHPDYASDRRVTSGVSLMGIIDKAADDDADEWASVNIAHRSSTTGASEDRVAKLEKPGTSLQRLCYGDEDPSAECPLYVTAFTTGWRTEWAINQDSTFPESLVGTAFPGIWVFYSLDGRYKYYPETNIGSYKHIEKKHTGLYDLWYDARENHDLSSNVDMVGLLVQMKNRAHKFMTMERESRLSSPGNGQGACEWQAPSGGGTPVDKPAYNTEQVTEQELNGKNWETMTTTVPPEAPVGVVITAWSTDTDFKLWTFENGREMLVRVPDNCVNAACHALVYLHGLYDYDDQTTKTFAEDVKQQLGEIKGIDTWSPTGVASANLDPFIILAPLAPQHSKWYYPWEGGGAGGSSRPFGGCFVETTVQEYIEMPRWEYSFSRQNIAAGQKQQTYSCIVNDDSKCETNNHGVQDVCEVRAWNAVDCCGQPPMWRETMRGQDDAASVVAMLERFRGSVATHNHVDGVFLAGFSNGGFLADTIALRFANDHIDRLENKRDWIKGSATFGGHRWVNDTTAYTAPDGFKVYKMHASGDTVVNPTECLRDDGSSGDTDFKKPADCKVWYKLNPYTRAEAGSSHTNYRSFQQIINWWDQKLGGSGAITLSDKFIIGPTNEQRGRYSSDFAHDFTSTAQQGERRDLLFAMLGGGGAPSSLRRRSLATTPTTSYQFEHDGCHEPTDEGFRCMQGTRGWFPHELDFSVLDASHTCDNTLFHVDGAVVSLIDPGDRAMPMCSRGYKPRGSVVAVGGVACGASTESDQFAAFDYTEMGGANVNLCVPASTGRFNSGDGTSIKAGTGAFTANGRMFNRRLMFAAGAVAVTASSRRLVHVGLEHTEIDACNEDTNCFMRPILVADCANDPTSVDCHVDWDLAPSNVLKFKTKPVRIAMNLRYHESLAGFVYISKPTARATRDDDGDINNENCVRSYTDDNHEEGLTNRGCRSIVPCDLDHMELLTVTTTGVDGVDDMEFTVSFGDDEWAQCADKVAQEETIKYISHDGAETTHDVDYTGADKDYVWFTFDVNFVHCAYNAALGCGVDLNPQGECLDASKQPVLVDFLMSYLQQERNSDDWSDPHKSTLQNFFCPDSYSNGKKDNDRACSSDPRDGIFEYQYVSYNFINYLWHVEQGGDDHTTQTEENFPGFNSESNHDRVNIGMDQRCFLVQTPVTVKWPKSTVNIGQESLQQLEFSVGRMENMQKLVTQKSDAPFDGSEEQKWPTAQQPLSEIHFDWDSCSHWPRNPDPQIVSDTDTTTDACTVEYEGSASTVECGWKRPLTQAECTDAYLRGDLRPDGSDGGGSTDNVPLWSYDQRGGASYKTWKDAAGEQSADWEGYFSDEPTGGGHGPLYMGQPFRFDYWLNPNVCALDYSGRAATGYGDSGGAEYDDISGSSSLKCSGEQKSLYDLFTDTTGQATHYDFDVLGKPACVLYDKSECTTAPCATSVIKEKFKRKVTPWDCPMSVMYINNDADNPDCADCESLMRDKCPTPSVWWNCSGIDQDNIGVSVAKDPDDVIYEYAFYAQLFPYDTFTWAGVEYGPRRALPPEFFSPIKLGRDTDPDDPYPAQFDKECNDGKSTKSSSTCTRASVASSGSEQLTSRMRIKHSTGFNNAEVEVVPPKWDENARDGSDFYEVNWSGESSGTPISVPRTPESLHGFSVSGWIASQGWRPAFADETETLTADYLCKLGWKGDVDPGDDCDVSSDNPFVASTASSAPVPYRWGRANPTFMKFVFPLKINTKYAGSPVQSLAASESYAACQVNRVAWIDDDTRTATAGDFTRTPALIISDTDYCGDPHPRYVPPGSRAMKMKLMDECVDSSTATCHPRTSSHAAMRCIGGTATAGCCLCQRGPITWTSNVSSQNDQLVNGFIKRGVNDGEYKLYSRESMAVAPISDSTGVPQYIDGTTLDATWSNNPDSDMHGALYDCDTTTDCYAGHSLSVYRVSTTIDGTDRTLHFGWRCGQRSIGGGIAFIDPGSSLYLKGALKQGTFLSTFDRAVMNKVQSGTAEIDDSQADTVDTPSSTVRVCVPYSLDLEFWTGMNGVDKWEDSDEWHQTPTSTDARPYTRAFSKKVLGLEPGAEFLTSDNKFTELYWLDNRVEATTRRRRLGDDTKRAPPPRARQLVEVSITARTASGSGAANLRSPVFVTRERECSSSKYDDVVFYCMQDWLNAPGELTRIGRTLHLATNTMNYTTVVTRLDEVCIPRAEDTCDEPAIIVSQAVLLGVTASVAGSFLLGVPLLLLYARVLVARKRRHDIRVVQTVRVWRRKGQTKKHTGKQNTNAANDKNDNKETVPLLIPGATAEMKVRFSSDAVLRMPSSWSVRNHVV